MIKRAWRQHIGEKDRKNTYICELIDILSEGLLGWPVKHRNPINIQRPII